MKMRFCGYLIAACMMACSTAVWAATPCTPDQEKQIKELREAWVSNWNAKKLDDIMNLYASDATYTPPDGTPISGKDKIRAYLEKQLGSQVSAESKTLDCSGGNTARDNGTYKEDFPGGGTTVLPNTTVLPKTTVIAGKGKHVEGI